MPEFANWAERGATLKGQAHWCVKGPEITMQIYKWKDPLNKWWQFAPYRTPTLSLSEQARAIGTLFLNNGGSLWVYNFRGVGMCHIFPSAWFLPQAVNNTYMAWQMNKHDWPAHLSIISSSPKRLCIDYYWVQNWSCWQWLPRMRTELTMVQVLKVLLAHQTLLEEILVLEWQVEGVQELLFTKPQHEKLNIVCP